MKDTHRGLIAVPSAGGDDLTASSGSVRLKLSAAQTDGGLSLLEVQSLPNDGPPLHRHRSAEEIFYVLEGDYWFESDGRRVDAHAGSLVLIPRGAAHRYDTGTGGRLLIMFTPAGSEGFFVGWARLAHDSDAVIDVDRLARLGAEYGIEFLDADSEARGDPGSA